MRRWVSCRAYARWLATASSPTAAAARLAALLAPAASRVGPAAAGRC